MMDIFPLTGHNKKTGALRIQELKEKIDDEDYLHEAIQRIALILSNEIAGTVKGEKKNGWKR
jgi:threonine aldolase